MRATISPGSARKSTSRSTGSPARYPACTPSIRTETPRAARASQSPSRGWQGSRSMAMSSRIRWAETEALRKLGTVFTRALKEVVSFVPWERKSVMVP